MQTIQHVEDDVNSSLDVVNLLRRLRMHGFAIALLLDKPLLKSISTVSQQKPLIDPAKLSQKSLWDKYEHVSFNEQILISLYKRFLRNKEGMETGRATSRAVDINEGELSDADKEEEFNFEGTDN